jgi:FMNH2-dependent dimethyl sulfone monooxygenase
MTKLSRRDLTAAALFARDLGDDVRLLTNPMVISPDTERETKAHCDAIVAYADPVANRQIFDSDAHVWKGRVGVDTKSQRAIGGNIEVAGTPKQVVEQFVRLKEAGIDGLQLSFFDVQSDLDHFGARVLPLMKQAGLRP